MFNSFAVSAAATQLARRAGRVAARITLAIIAAVVTAASATTVQAQTAETVQAQTAETVEAQTAPAHTRNWEFLINTGTVVPTGDQRDVIARGKLMVAQLSYVVHPALAITTTFGWARSRDIATIDDPKLDVFTYDLGAEVRAPRQGIGGGFTFRPFAGIGAGARSYNYRNLDVDATHNIAGYGSAGGELGFRRVRLRVEARNYVTGFKPLAGTGDAVTRNDVAVMAGLRFTTR